MLSKYKFVPLFFLFLIFCILILSGCNGDTLSPTQMFTTTPTSKSTDEQLDITVTAISQPTPVVIEDTKLPEPTATIVQTLEPEEEDIPTKTPDPQEETQGDSDNQTGDSVETQPSPTATPQSVENDTV